MSRPLAALLCLLALAALAGCGRGEDGSNPLSPAPSVGVKSSNDQAARDLGFPATATKNTTRIGGADPIADAAGTARAVFPATSSDSRPQAVALIDARDWHAGVAGAVLASTPVRAAVLLSDGPKMPPASQDALEALGPTGAGAAGGAQLIRVGDAASPNGLRTTALAGRDPFALARAIDAFQSAAKGRPSQRVIVVGADDPAYAMPAAAWAAKAGDPVLFVRRDAIPPDTRAALKAHAQPKIYVLGPPSAVSRRVENQLGSLGKVTRIGAGDPVSSSIAFARYVDPSFGWGVVDPGHGIVFARTDRPLDAAAAAPLSVSGSYGPLVLLSGPDAPDARVRNYLLDIQPGYTRDPVRGVYNHGWIVGDDKAISVASQAAIDGLLEIRKTTSTADANPQP
ncbi:MAG: cell wall-binding repeat-containing protein [Solirubrobacteraceae bacterium]